LRAEAAARQKSEADAYTVRRLVDDWDRLALAKRRKSYRRDALSRLNLHLAAMLDKPAAAVTRADAACAVDCAAERGGATTSRRVKQYASTMFTWAAGRGAVPGNPFLGVAGVGAEAPRDRVLASEEIGTVWRAAGTLPPPFGPFVRVLMLTLARREEVAAMCWGELAADLSTWTLPALRSKNRKPHVQHLAEPTRAILAGMGRGEASELVFATLAGKTITTHSHIKRLLDKAIAAERKKAGKPPMPGWVFHDFRRAGVTMLAEAGFPPHVADKLLNHVSGTIRGVAAIYQRGELAALCAARAAPRCLRRSRQRRMGRVAQLHQPRCRTRHLRLKAHNPAGRAGLRQATEMSCRTFPI
jgi:integrase